MYLQDHPPQHVLPSQSAMRLGGFPQRIACGDRHTNPALREVPIQPLELPRVRDHVEGLHAERASLRGHGLDAVRVHEASARPYEVETPLKAITPGERKHAIKSVRDKISKLIDRFSSAGIDHALSAQRSNETCSRGAGCGRDDVRPALRGELHRHAADSAGRTEDQHGMSGPQLERVEALQCGQAGRGNRSGIAQVEILRDTGHVRGVCGGKLCVEATLAIAPLVRVDVVAESKAADSRAFGDDDSGPINSGHQGESRSSGLSQRSVANRGIPAADAGRLDRDEHFVRSRRWHWDVVQCQHRRRTESIDRRSFHADGDRR
jgi:hypothetical protein